MGGIEALLVLPVAAFHLAIVSWCIGLNEFVADTQLSSGFLKESGQVLLAVGKAVGKLKAVIRLDTFHMNTSAGIPFDQSLQEVCGRVSRLLRISPQEPEAGELVNGGVLEQAQFWVHNTNSGNHLHIHLDSFSRVCHLLIGLGCILLFLLSGREHAQFSHNPKQALGPAGIASLP